MSWHWRPEVLNVSREHPYVDCDLCNPFQKVWLSLSWGTTSQSEVWFCPRLDETSLRKAIQRDSTVSVYQQVTTLNVANEDLITVRPNDIITELKTMEIRVQMIPGVLDEIFLQHQAIWDWRETYREFVISSYGRDWSFNLNQLDISPWTLKGKSNHPIAKTSYDSSTGPP